MNLKRHDEGIRHLEGVGRASPSLALYAFSLQIGVLWNLGRYGTVWKLMPDLSRVVEEARKGGVDEEHPDFARSYGALLRLLGDRPKAIELYKKAIQNAPEDTWLRAELIATHVEERDATSATTAPETPDLRYSREPEETRASHFGMARDEFARALALSQRVLQAKRNPKHLLALAGLYIHIGRYENAAPLLREVIELGDMQQATSTEIEYSRAFLGLVNARTGHYDRAVREFSAALGHEPDDLNYQIGCAEAYLRMGRSAEAERDYRRILEAAPCNVEARIGLAEALTAQGDNGQPGRYELAERQFAQAIELAVSTASPEPRRREGSTALNRRQLATLYYEQGYSLTRIYEAETTRGPLRGGRASDYLSAARKAFADAIKTDPTHPQAAAAMDRVRQELHERRSVAGTQTSWALVGICMVLLVLVHLFFFVPWFRESLEAEYRKSLTPTTYGMLTFGLIALLIAAVSLPQLLKLKVAGIALEKTAVEKATGPASLDLTRESGMPGLVSKPLSIPLPTDPIAPTPSGGTAPAHELAEPFEKPPPAGDAAAGHTKRGADVAAAQPDHPSPS